MPKLNGYMFNYVILTTHSSPIKKKKKPTTTLIFLIIIQCEILLKCIHPTSEAPLVQKVL